MSFATAVTQFSSPLLSLTELLQGALVLALLAGVMMFFRPLLSGLVRALVLSVRPRPARPARGAGA